MRSKLKNIVFWGIVAILLCCFPFLAVTAFAEPVQDNFVYFVENGEATIVRYNGVNNQKTDLVIPANLGGCPVTAIADHAFSYFYALQSVSFPESLTSIGEAAFEECNGLSTVEIPANVTNIGASPFLNCFSLMDIHVAEDNPNYTSVDGVLFNKAKTELIQFPCRRNEPYIIPSGVTTIGKKAFAYSYRFSQAIIPDSVTTIKEAAFCYSAVHTIVIPDSVTTIEESAFLGCSSLERVVVGKGITEIRPYMFYLCSQLKELAIGENVTSIGEKAFYKCYHLGEVYIPKSVKYIGVSAFEDASPSPLYIYDTVETIDESAFYKCGNFFTVYCMGETFDLSKITIKNGNGSILNAKFHHNDFVYQITDGTVSVLQYNGQSEDVTIPSVFSGYPVTRVDHMSFSRNETLTVVRIPDSVKNISEEAFSYCYALKTVYLGKNINAFGEWVFHGCSALKDIYYAGSKADRDKIGSSYIDEQGKATWHYLTKPQPTKPVTVPPTTAPCHHIFVVGLCRVCGAADPNYNPCANGHTYVKGDCMNCDMTDPDYDPCANGHTYVNGKCDNCGAASPIQTTKPTTVSPAVPGDEPQPFKLWPYVIVIVAIVAASAVALILVEVKKKK